MALVNAISEAVSRRGGTLITRIKQDLRAAGKSATGELINNTKGETRIVGNATVLFEGKAPEHYVYVDQGRRAGATPPPVKAIQSWINSKGLDLNAFAVAKSIGKKGIKPTKIYSNNVDRFLKELNLESDLRGAIINEIKQI